MQANNQKGEKNPSKIAFNLNNNMSCGDATKACCFAIDKCGGNGNDGGHSYLANTHTPNRY